MKEAVSYYGKKAKVKEWAIVVKDERPYYQVRLIDGKQDSTGMDICIEEGYRFSFFQYKSKLRE